MSATVIDQAVTHPDNPNVKGVVVEIGTDYHAGQVRVRWATRVYGSGGPVRTWVKASRLGLDL